MRFQNLEEAQRAHGLPAERVWVAAIGESREL
jgi:hypothetical protein